MAFLHKVLESQKEKIVRFCCAEDLALLEMYASPESNALDNCVADILSNIGDTSNFYKVETDTGAIMGYFAQALPIDGIWVLESFLMRKQFRTKEYIDMFWDLVRSAFENEIYVSIDASNIKAQNHLLKNNFVIQNKGDYFGRKYVLLKSSI